MWRAQELRVHLFALLLTMVALVKVDKDYLLET
jgi:hypothetical protein